MTQSLPSYRRGFVEACLAKAPPGAVDWLGRLDDVLSRVVAPLAPTVDRERAYPFQSLGALKEIGAMGVAAPAEVGGLDFGDAIAAMVVETVAAACPSTAAILMFHTQVVRRVRQHGTPRQKQEDLPRLARGEWMGASAWSELGAGADKSRLSTHLQGEPGKWLAVGEKAYCTGLEGAGIIHVLLGAPAANGALAPTFVRVRTGGPAVDLSEVYDLMGLRASSTGTVRLSGVPVTEEDVVGGLGQGMALMRANHESLMNPGLLALGIARAAYEEVKRATTGGWPGMHETIDYQNTRFSLADMELQIGSAYAYAAQCIRDVNAGRPELNVECSKVKVLASTMAAHLTAASLQLAGARGFTTPWPLERFFRDARATLLMGPTNEIIKEQIAKQIVGSRTPESTR
jgi:alkylation response protein AidB-like acyl-CoA dehydrogenase